MTNLNNLVFKRENNQLEVKEAKNGLPISIWETYSSFANSYGGIILLGVSESLSKDLIPIGLTENEASNLVKSFWDTIHSDKVSVNLLTDNHISIEKIDKSFIVIINVPQASRFDKPVHLNNNLNLSYRRNHEGDYKCSKSEIINMIRDNDMNSQDSYIAEKLLIDDLCKETINKYRTHFINYKGSKHPFSDEPLELFLRHIGAAKYDEKGILRPTKAGLLMFGYNYDIVTVFPNYFLDYQDKRNIFGEMRWINRIYSSSGDWSGNLLDFFFRIHNYLIENVKTPFKLEGFFRIDITPMHKAIREVLCNCLSNADFNETRGVVIKQYNNKLEFSNPGAFSMNKELAMAGGNSDARNKTILTMFNNIDIGERTGSGIPLIMSATNEEGYIKPIFKDYFRPDFTIVIIYLSKEKSSFDTVMDSNKLNIIKPEISSEKPEISSEKPEISSNNFENNNYIFIINNLSIRNDIKEKLIEIYQKLKDKIVSNSIIVETLQIGHNSADTCIKTLIAYDLIIPVKGYGKGKYKFK